MKKIVKSRVFAFILGAILFGSIGVVSAYTLFANDIGYTPNDATWEVSNVKDAIDDLYEKGVLNISSLQTFENTSLSSTRETSNNISLSDLFIKNFSSFFIRDRIHKW